MRRMVAAAATIWIIIVCIIVECTEGHGEESTSLVAKFGYVGGMGPWNWARLSPEYMMCAQGKHQSPINIVTNEAVLEPNLHSLDRFYSKHSNATLVDNGFNVMVKYAQGAGSVFVDGNNYTLKQMHWHSPSEHTLNGRKFAAELHLVHATEEGDLAVVAILYRYGRPDPVLARLKAQVEELKQNQKQKKVVTVDTKPLRRRTSNYYRYTGSLTTPPCSENVIWSVVGKVRQIAREQVESLVDVLGQDYHTNARPVQDLNGRKVFLYHHNN